MTSHARGASIQNLWDLRAEVDRTADLAWLDHWNGGAEDEVTLVDNHLAYERIRLWPRVLAGLENVDQGVRLPGLELRSPLVISPMGMHGAASPDGERATAIGAERGGALLTIPAGSSQPLEAIASLDGARLFQVSLQADARVTEWFIRRAEAAGYRGIVLTVDAPVLGRRERNLRRASPSTPVSLGNYALPDDPTSPAAEIARDLGLAAVPTELTYRPSQGWRDLEWCRSLTALPLYVKGVIRADDAERAFDSGADVVWISNHGGRQLDGTVATIDALPHVVARVGPDRPIVIDGGVRRGTDVLKALALGATAVAVGRPIMWGLAHSGADGVQLVIEMLRDELQTAMRLAGVASAGNVTVDVAEGP